MKHYSYKQNHTAGWFGVKKLSLFLVLLCVSISIQAQRVINLNDEGVAIRAVSSSVIPQEFLAEAKAARAFAINPVLQRAGSVEVGDIINLQLFEDSNYKAVVRRVTTNVNGNFTIALNLLDYRFAFGFITTNTEGKSLVNVSIPERNKEFVSRINVNTRTSYLIQVDENAFDYLPSGPPMEVPVVTYVYMNEEDKAESIQGLNLRNNAICRPCQNLGDADPAAISLLVVYTQEAADWAASGGRGGINNIIAGMDTRTMEVVDNQGNNDIIYVIHSELISHFTEQSMNMVDDLTRLTNDTIVQRLRLEHEAAVVMLLGVYYDFGGMAWVMTGWHNPLDGFINSAYSITRIQQAHTGFTGIHEIGHNMGMLHEVENNDITNPLFPYAFGWRWQNNTGFGMRWYNSVMSVGSGVRIPFFSSPDVDHHGVQTGHGLANNAQVFRNMKHAFAFHSDRLAMALPAPENIVISNPRENGATFTWDVVPGAVNYIVYISNGTTTRQWWSATNSITITDTSATPLLTACNTFEVWLEARNVCGDRGWLSERVTFRTFCPATDPVVTTLPADDITTTTATLNKTVVPASGHPVASQGFRYRAVDSSTWSSSTTGILTGLTPNTIYQFYAYAVTASNEIFRSNILTFVTYACEDFEQIIYVVQTRGGWSGGWHGGAALAVRQNGVEIQRITTDTHLLTPHSVALCPCKDIDFVWIRGSLDRGNSFIIRDNLNNIIYQSPMHNTNDLNAGAAGYYNNQVVFSVTMPAYTSPLVSFEINTTPAKNIVRHTCDDPRGEIIFDNAFVVAGNAEIFFALASGDYVLYLNNERLVKTGLSADFDFGNTPGPWTGVLQVVRPPAQGHIISAFGTVNGTVVATYDIALTIGDEFGVNIDEIPVNREVQSVQCYTVTGIRVDCDRAPQGSVIIQRTIYTDGSVEVETRVNTGTR